MNELEFKTKYESEKQIFGLWGEYVTNKIVELLSVTEDIDLFLKVSPKARIKDTNSLILKAFYRNKGYKDPYNEITDKVGTRFVVLLIRDVYKIAKIIEECNDWSYSKDRDFEDEREKNPAIFEYQSVHFIVRSKEIIKYKDNDIPQNIPCEIQIRTLLQHAYSELTHDTIYKPQTIASPLIHRKVARCMALIETTDDIFKEVDEVFSTDKVNFDKTICELNTYYSKITCPDYERKLNLLIFDAYKDVVSTLKLEKIIECINDEKELVNEFVLKNYNRGLIYRQPIILLMYYLISKYRYKARMYWPLTDNLLHPMFTELGIAFDSLDNILIH